MPRTRTSSAVELLLPLDREAAEPLHRQLERELREAVRSGRVAAGTVLPSSRALASQLGVSRGIVVEAYEQLNAEGYLATRPGGLTTVAHGGRPAPPRPNASELQHFEYDFRPGRPDLDLFPRDTWLRSIRRALDVMPSSRLGYLDGKGMPELRHALADYLNRVRGTAADAEDIVICAGFAQGLKLVAGVLRDRGAKRIGVEDPTQPETAEDLRSLGLKVVDLPVDDAGLVVERLDGARVDAVVVTAAHQYPTGGVMTAERRTALLEWAERRKAIVVEDDYDAEYRYDRDPVGALQGLAPDRIVYAGSASKILAPGLRLGWFVVPSVYAPAVAAAKRAADSGSPAIDQLAFADFLARGELDRHLRRLRPIYRARRDALLDALARHLPELRPVGASAGLHVLAWLPPDLDEEAVVDAAATAGIRLQGVGRRAAVASGTGASPAAPPGGLTFGYGVIPEPAIETAVIRLAEVFATVRQAASAAAS